MVYPTRRNRLIRTVLLVTGIIAASIATLGWYFGFDSNAVFGIAIVGSVTFGIGVIIPKSSNSSMKSEQSRKPCPEPSSQSTWFSAKNAAGLVCVPSSQRNVLSVIIGTHEKHKRLANFGNQNELDKKRLV